MIEFIEFTDDITHNLNEVRKGLAGIEITYVGHFNRLVDNPLPMEALMGFMRPYWFFGSLELYANGRAIIFVKNALRVDRVIGFLRYTPEELNEPG